LAFAQIKVDYQINGNPVAIPLQIVGNTANIEIVNFQQSHRAVSKEKRKRRSQK